MTTRASKSVGAKGTALRAAVGRRAVLKGAALLGRHLAMFTDRAVVDMNHGLQEMDDDALEAYARRMAEKLGGTLPLRLITPTGGKVR